LRGATQGGFSVQTISPVSGAHPDIVPAKCFFNVVKRIADLSRECLTSHAVDDVLVLTLREFGAAAKRLP